MVQKEPLPEGKADGLAQSNASPAAKDEGSANRYEGTLFAYTNAKKCDVIFGLKW